MKTSVTFLLMASGNTSKWKNAFPHVLTATVNARTAMMFITKPAEAYKKDNPSLLEFCKVQKPITKIAYMQ